VSKLPLPSRRLDVPDEPPADALAQASARLAEWQTQARSRAMNLVRTLESAATRTRTQTTAMAFAAGMGRSRSLRGELVGEEDSAAAGGGVGGEDLPGAVG
jgi:hypothetical protein